jgi:HNH endonuclease
LGEGAIKENSSEKFFARVVGKDQEDSCWLWQGPFWGRESKDGKRYGYFWYSDDDGKQRLIGAHRFAWILAHGPIPKGLWVCHQCDNPPCVNAEKHLFLGTPSEDMFDCVRKGRRVIPGGADNPASKLTWDSVERIRDLYRQGKTQDQIALMFGITQPNVGYIVRGDTWKTDTYNGPPLINRSVGESNPNRKLSFDQVKEIRDLYRAGVKKQVELAVEYGVTQAQISAIVRCVAWKNLPCNPEDVMISSG